MHISIVVLVFVGDDDVGEKKSPANEIVILFHALCFFCTHKLFPLSEEVPH